MRFVDVPRWVRLNVPSPLGSGSCLQSPPGPSHASNASSPPAVADRQLAGSAALLSFTPADVRLIWNICESLPVQGLIVKSGGLEELEHAALACSGSIIPFLTLDVQHSSKPPSSAFS